LTSTSLADPLLTLIDFASRLRDPDYHPSTWSPGKPPASNQTTQLSLSLPAAWPCICGDRTSTCCPAIRHPPSAIQHPASTGTPGTFLHCCTAAALPFGPLVLDYIWLPLALLVPKSTNCQKPASWISKVALVWGRPSRTLCTVSFADPWRFPATPAYRRDTFSASPEQAAAATAATAHTRPTEPKTSQRDYGSTRFDPTPLHTTHPYPIPSSPPVCAAAEGDTSSIPRCPSSELHLQLFNSGVLLPFSTAPSFSPFSSSLHPAIATHYASCISSTRSSTCMLSSWHKQRC
jgi:hypothetical protein